jgi:hypothetical protein
MKEIHGSELRVGNYLNIIDPTEAYKDCPIVVDSIVNYREREVPSNTDYLISFYSPKANVSHYDMELDAFEPIKLSKKWLLALGFERGGYDLLEWEHPSVEGFLLAGINWADAEWPEYQFLNYKVGKNILHIYYVHELQNLYFALSGKELTIEYSNESK